MRLPSTGSFTAWFIREVLLKNPTTRREFVKTAVAASFSGVALAAEAAPNRPEGSAPVGNTGPAAKPGTAKQPTTEAAGYPRVYSGRRLARISCPLGGIGTGGIGLGGRGNLQDWQIFNRPEIGNSLELPFPACGFASRAGSYSAVLERRLLPPYDLQEKGFRLRKRSRACRAWPRPGSSGRSLCRASSLKMPTARSKLRWRHSRLFSHCDAEASGLPCAVLVYKIHNPGKTAGRGRRGLVRSPTRWAGPIANERDPRTRRHQRHLHDRSHRSPAAIRCRALSCWLRCPRMAPRLKCCRSGAGKHPGSSVRSISGLKNSPRPETWARLKNPRRP